MNTDLYRSTKEPVKLAVFYDYQNAPVPISSVDNENNTLTFLNNLLIILNQIGDVVMSNAYSHWTFSENEILKSLYSVGFIPIHIPIVKPNSVDLKLAVDVVKLSYERPDINTFCLISGDKDFIPILNHLRAKNKTIIIIGKDQASSPYIKDAAHMFISIEDIVNGTIDFHRLSYEKITSSPKSYYSTKQIFDSLKSKPIEQDPKPVSKPASSLSVEQAIDTLVRSIIQAKKDNILVTISSLDVLMRKINQKYKGVASIKAPREVGNFSKFIKFLKYVKQLGIITFDDNASDTPVRFTTKFEDTLEQENYDPAYKAKFSDDVGVQN